MPEALTLKNIQEGAKSLERSVFRSSGRPWLGQAGLATQAAPQTESEDYLL